MKFKVIVRSGDMELRGVVEHEDALAASEIIHNLGLAMEPFGALVIASPADDHYNPFALDEL